MIINHKILENLFLEFIQFIQQESREELQSFSSSKYLIENENFKSNVYDEVRKTIGKNWSNALIITTNY